MKKLYLLVLAFAIAFTMSGLAFASVEIDSGDNAVIVGPKMGPQGLTPVTEVIKVSTGSGTGATVGDVMVWDYSNAADGYHVKRCSVDSGTATEIFAGVMVTTTSQETEYSYSSPKANGGTVGYMAIRGLVRALIDTSGATAGQRLALNGATLAASFKTIAATATRASQDIGILLEESGTDSINRVWLK